jgi:glutamine synthetase
MSSRDLAIFLTNDLAGMSRGRAFPARDLGHRMEAGVGWVPANLALTAFGDIGENPFGPVGDLRLQPEPDSTGFKLTGFGEEPGLFAFLCNIVETDGRPWGGCPRHFAKEALADLKRDTGLVIKASFEQEFFLLGINLAVNSAFTLIDFRDVQRFLGALTEALTAAGIEPETILREYGPQQFELTMKPSHGLLAADRAVMLREITRDVARQFGGRACFAPIIDPGSVGSGVHLHFSLETIDGRAATHDPAKPGGISAAAGSFVAGVLRHMPALCALAAPSLISYLRLTPHRWSSGFNCFAYRNREAGVRIAPVDDTPGREIARQTHLEFRAGDATASPYVQLGALVRAGLEGMRANLPAPPLVEGDPADLSAAQLNKLGIRRLPETLLAALAELEKDATAMGWLPEPMRRSFFAMKRTEMAKLQHLDSAGQCARYAAVY